ncbi:unnamed protein product [Mesocestoides corti]|uniref:Adenylate cyclase-stimulating G alpha protein n=2 Tax=Mesocestoides corti TaxID=53468 RepID=A0A0R3UKL3_MESCO|nr:unnamed protein product [Mesocestoides corti]
MDCFSSEERRRNDFFLKIIQQHGSESKNIHRILLIGTGESGKSTFVKQMKLLSSPNGTFPESYRSKFITEIQRNIVQALANICSFMIIEAIPFENRKSIAMAELQKRIIEIYEEIRIKPESIANYTQDADATKRSAFFDMCNALWEDRAVKATQDRGNEFQQIDSAAYFLEKLNEIRNPEYSPSDKDVLQCRTKTLGIHTETIFYHGIPFELVDVGGQREQRAKWIEAVTDGVTAVIFLTDASAYDTMLEEDHSVNRLRESYQLLGQVWNKSLFKDKSFILFLNKQDKLASKVRSQRTPIIDFFPEYELGKFKFTITFLSDMLTQKKRKKSDAEVWKKHFSYFLPAASKASAGSSSGAMTLDEIIMEEYNQVQSMINKAVHDGRLAAWPLTGDVKDGAITTLMEDEGFVALFNRLMDVALYRTVTVTHFIKTLFLAECEQTKERRVYPYPTTAIDKRNVIRVFDSCKEILQGKAFTEMII